MPRANQPVLCGLDGMADDERLTRVATHVANALGSTLSVVHVLGANGGGPAHADGGPPGARNERRLGVQQAAATAEARLRQLGRVIDGAAVQVRVLRFGDPARRLA